MKNIDFIIDNNNQLHTAIVNKNNSFCFLITVLQWLKCSNTLTDLLQSYFNKFNIDILKFILKPCYIYSKLNDKNKTIKVMEELTNFLYSEEFSNKVIRNNGYCCTLLLQYYYFPAIYHFINTFDKTNVINIFKKILNEISMNSPSFNYTYLSSEIRNTVEGNNYLSDECEYEMNDYYDDFYKIFYKNVKKIVYNEFIASPLVIQPNEDERSNLHVVILIKSKNNYFIIDDTRGIFSIKEFLDRNLNVYSLCIEIGDSDVCSDLNKLYKPIFTLSECHVKAKPKLTTSGQKSVKIKGGNKLNVLPYIFIILLIITIVVISVCLTSKKLETFINNKHENSSIHNIQY